LSKPHIVGLTVDSDIEDPDELWRAAFSAQVKAKRGEKRNSQRIEIPDAKPFALALLSDIHIGSASTDYRQAKADAEIVRDTPGMYAGYHGDGVDNWILSKLAGLQRNQALTFDSEIQLFGAWLNLLKGKLLFAVSGNHDNWTHILSGFDRIRGALRGTQCLYDQHEVTFDLGWNRQQWKIKARHSFSHRSIFNVTHGLEVNWERGGTDFDIVVGGHTHVGALCRPFYRQGKKRFACLTGTYKVDDEFGRKIGAAPSRDRGCGALVFSQDGIFWTENLGIASQFLGYLRGKRSK